MVLSGRVATVSTRSSGRPRRQGLWRLLILVVMLLILVAYIQPVMKYIDRSSQIESERAATDELRSEFDVLSSEMQHLQSNDYIEQVARRDLGLVKPGEQPYVVKDLDQSATDIEAQTVVEEKSQPDASTIPPVLEDFPLPRP